MPKKHRKKTDIKLRYCRSCIEEGVHVLGKTVINESSCKKHFMFVECKKKTYTFYNHMKIRTLLLCKIIVQYFAYF